MSEVKFDVLNARVTFKNVPLHSLARFAFKDVAAASEAFKKIPGVEEYIEGSEPKYIDCLSSPHVCPKKFLKNILTPLNNGLYTLPSKLNKFMSLLVLGSVLYLK